MSGLSLKNIILYLSTLQRHVKTHNFYHTSPPKSRLEIELTVSITRVFANNRYSMFGTIYIGVLAFNLIVCVDIRSVGVIAYMLVTGESPFAGEDKQETFLNVSQVNVDYSREAFSRVSELAVDFIQKLLVKSPE